MKNPAVTESLDFTYIGFETIQYERQIQSGSFLVAGPDLLGQALAGKDDGAKVEHAARPKQATLSLVISLSSADVERSTVWTKLGMSPSEARVDPTAPQVRIRLASSTPFVEFIALSHPTTPLDPEGLPKPRPGPSRE